MVARTEKLPTEHLTELSRLRSGPRFQVIVVAVSTLFGLAQMEEATRFFDYLRVGEGAMDLCNVTLIVLRSANDSLPTYGEMCSVGEKQASASVTHVLFLSEAHVPRDVHFLKRMLEPFSLPAPAWGVQCTIIESQDPPSVDAQANLRRPAHTAKLIVDHGLELGRTVDHLHEMFTVTRRLRGFSERDSRIRLSDRAHLVSLYCSLWDRAKLRTVGMLPSHQATIIDRVLQGRVNSRLLLDAQDLVRYRILRVEKAMEAITLVEVHQSGTALRQQVRLSYSEVVDATTAWEETTGRSFDSVQTQYDGTPLDRKEREELADVETMTTVEKLKAHSRRLQVALMQLRSVGRNRDTETSEEKIGWHLSMQVQAAGGALYASSARADFVFTLLPKAVQDYFQSNNIDPVYPSYTISGEFQREWSAQIQELLNADAEPHPMRVFWDAFCCGCCGFSSELTHFVVPLARKREVHVIPGPQCFCSGYPVYVQDALSRAHVTTDQYTIMNPPKSSTVTVWISHTDPMAYRNPSFDRRPPDYVVGRSMYEFSRIGENWVGAIGAANEVWVPAKFVATAFAISGVPKEKLVVIPEAVDTYFFDPDVQDAVPLPLDGPRAKRWIHYCNSDHSSVAASPRAFKFFSNFKWEPRKGWETLFEAYWRAFGSLSRSERPVSLYILTYYFFNNVKAGDIHNVTLMVDALAQWAKAKLHVESLAEFPHFCLITETITETELAGLYKSADAFVLPTRGEGWCLPAIEAMSMGLPTIATAWGGQTEFMTRDNSFLILPDAVEEPPEDNMYGFQVGKKWATPSMNHTAQLMQYVYSHPVHAKRVGERARRHVEEHFSEEAVATTVDNRLRKIGKIIAASGGRSR